MVFALCAYVLAALFAERRQHEALLQEALATGSVMAFEWNLITGLARCSENAAEILGLGSQQTFTAAQFLARIHPDDQARFKEHHRQAHIDIPATVTFRFIRPTAGRCGLRKPHERNSTRSAASCASRD